MTNIEALKRAKAYFDYYEISSDLDLEQQMLFVNFTSNDTMYSVRIADSEIEHRAWEYDDLVAAGIIDLDND